MENNVNLYNAARHMLSAAKLLTETNEEIRNYLLNSAEKLLSEIVIDEKEIQEIERYESILKEKISRNRTDNHTSL